MKSALYVFPEHKRIHVNLSYRQMCQQAKVLAQLDPFAFRFEARACWKVIYQLVC